MKANNSAQAKFSTQAINLTQGRTSMQANSKSQSSISESCLYTALGDDGNVDAIILSFEGCSDGGYFVGATLRAVEIAWNP